MEMHKFIMDKEIKRYNMKEFSLGIFKEAISSFFNKKQIIMNEQKYAEEWAEKTLEENKETLEEKSKEQFINFVLYGE